MRGFSVATPPSSAAVITNPETANLVVIDGPLRWAFTRWMGRFRTRRSFRRHVAHSQAQHRQCESIRKMSTAPIERSPQAVDQQASKAGLRTVATIEALKGIIVLVLG